MFVEGGYYIKARAIMQSEIMKQPPHVREVWDWLLMNANHAAGKSSGIAIERGQLFTSLDEIRDGLSWYIGYRKSSYTKDHMKKAMKALKKASMITTSKSTRGILITICNYERFQNPKNYESTNESTNESTIKAPSKHQGSTTINKKNNNNKNEINNKYTDDFENFWSLYGKIGNKAKAQKSFKELISKGVSYEKIIASHERYARYCQQTEWYHKQHASTWLNPKNKNWESEWAVQVKESPSDRKSREQNEAAARGHMRAENPDF